MEAESFPPTEIFMTGINLNIEQLLTAQLLEQLDEETRNDLFRQAIEKTLGGERLKDLLKSRLSDFAEQEVRRQMDTPEIRGKIEGLVNGAFALIFAENEDNLKAKLAKAIIAGLEKDRY
jgi:hypothetical protein